MTPPQGAPVVIPKTQVAYTDINENNMAQEVARPLWDKGPNWDFCQYRKHFLQDVNLMDKDSIKLPEVHFMNGLDNTDDLDTVVLTSYPRSGNTLMRGTLERIMGLVTGSDTDISKSLNLALMDAGLGGEGLVDRRVWVVKTHYPERYGKARYASERAILLVRSPIDCITSLFNMVCTDTHDLSISDQDYMKNYKLWNEFVEQEATVWNDYHNFWLKSAIPCHIIRYEDICKQPAKSLNELFKFIFSADSLEGTLIQTLIDMHIADKPVHVYKPRKGQVNGNKAFFAKNQLSYMRSTIPDTIKKFGYSDIFDPKIENGQFDPSPAFMVEHNAQALRQSIHSLYQSMEVVSIWMNYPQMLVRKKSTQWPNGRTAGKYRPLLLKNITVVGTSTMKTICELNQKETADDEEETGGNNK